MTETSENQNVCELEKFLNQTGVNCAFDNETGDQYLHVNKGCQTSNDTEGLMSPLTSNTVQPQNSSA